jgi:hypothetical protein
MANLTEANGQAMPKTMLEVNPPVGSSLSGDVNALETAVPGFRNLAVANLPKNVGCEALLMFQVVAGVYKIGEGNSPASKAGRCSFNAAALVVLN